MTTKSFSLKKWARSRSGQQVLVCIGFMIIPLFLLFLFTYFPFAEMIKFSFYKMTYTTPVAKRLFRSVKAQLVLHGRSFDSVGVGFISCYNLKF